MTAPSFDGLKMREALGLAADAPDEDVSKTLVALASQSQPASNGGSGNPAEDHQLPPRIPGRNTDNEAVLVDPSQLAALRAAAYKGEEAYERMRRKERDDILDTAIKAGKFPPVRRQHYETLWNADPEGTRDTINALAPNLIPVLASGFPGADDAASAADLAYKALYAEEAKNRG